MPDPSFRLAVLNPGGRDPEQDFADGPGAPGAGPHAPVNFHGYAACTHGSFHREVDAALATGRPILLLLRRDLRAGLRVIQQLKAAGRTVAVTFKEAGATQLAARLTSPADLTRLGEIVALADGCLSPAPWLAAFLGGFGKPSAFIPTPYPLDDPRWDFSRPTGERRGIFVGTREFGVPSRQHLAALVAARQLSERTGGRVTVFNTDGSRGAKMLAALEMAGLRVLGAPLPYAEYLRLVAGHRLVFQLDRSGVPGQVAGDALLCRVPCVGGDGAVEQLAFGEWCGVGRTARELIEIATELIRNPVPAGNAAAVTNSVIAPQLEAFYTKISP